MQTQNFNIGKWTNTEHNSFLNLVELFGRDWKKISNVLETRTETQVRSHAQKFVSKIYRRLDPSRKTQTPTLEEEALYKKILKILEQ